MGKIEEEVDEKAMDNLRDLFKSLLEILDIKIDDQDTQPPENVCRKILYNLGEDPSLSMDIHGFRTNIHTFLRHMIRPEIFKCASEHSASKCASEGSKCPSGHSGSVDDIILYLLQNPHDLQ